MSDAASPQARIPSVDPAGASALLDEGAVLLDVRENDEWDAGHAPEATHVALGDLSGAHEREELPAGRRIVAVCRSGGRSAAATRALREAGYDAVNLEGGMRAWADAGRPVVTDAGAPGAVV